jgi:hypothetical protein
VENKTYIYALTCPETEAAYYVGKTRDPVGRYRQHIIPSSLKPVAGTRNGKLTDKQRWVVSLLERGLTPNLAILETLEIQEGEDWFRLDERVLRTEKEWIERLRAAGHPLTTSTLEPQADAERLISEAEERGRALVARAPRY